MLLLPHSSTNYYFNIYTFELHCTLALHPKLFDQEYVLFLLVEVDSPHQHRVESAAVHHHLLQRPGANHALPVIHAAADPLHCHGAVYNITDTNYYQSLYSAWNETEL